MKKVISLLKITLLILAITSNSNVFGMKRTNQSQEPNPTKKYKKTLDLAALHKEQCARKQAEREEKNTQKEPEEKKYNQETAKIKNNANFLGTLHKERHAKRLAEHQKKVAEEKKLQQQKEELQRQKEERKQKLIESIKEFNASIIQVQYNIESSSNIKIIIEKINELLSYLQKKSLTLEIINEMKSKCEEIQKLIGTTALNLENLINTINNNSYLEINFAISSSNDAQVLIKRINSINSIFGLEEIPLQINMDTTNDPNLAQTIQDEQVAHLVQQEDSDLLLAQLLQEQLNSEPLPPLPEQNNLTQSEPEQNNDYMEISEEEAVVEETEIQPEENSGLFERIGNFFTGWMHKK